ncbi:MAG: hypothetical protein GNW80_12095 [Asgard group archaeon]|nr:hypothetical protein [Asgard group archaeon]
MFKKRSNEILEKLEGRETIRVSKGANFFGQESLKLRQVRGNGVLVLTPDELYFEMWLPKRICQIPISSIIDIEITKWHLKKSKNRDLLKVIFTNFSGETDSAAWLVREPELWISDLRNQISRRK